MPSVKGRISADRNPNPLGKTDMKTPKVGDTIRIIKMDDYGWDKQAREYNGRVGVVESIDSCGQLHGTWGGLAVQLEHDEIEIIS